MSKPLPLIALLALLGFAALSFTPSEVHAKEERRAVRFEFPSAPSGFDLGEKALRAYVKDNALAADTIV
ncbi:MAG: hypothetical protein KDB07_00970 [Planctomycetes bacterium]|nr:hypothetical protein [Planctomycetota bacterium]